MAYKKEEFCFGLDLTGSCGDTFSEFIESESMDLGDAFFMGSNKRKGPFVVVADIT